MARGLIVLNNDTIVCEDCYEPQNPEVDPGQVPYGRTYVGMCYYCGIRANRWGDEPLSPAAEKILDALMDEPYSERDLFIRLRPMDRVALYHTLRDLVKRGLVTVHDRGTLPGPVVTLYRLRQPLQP